ncbi:unnamed protein product [Urochloa humidicola]
MDVMSDDVLGLILERVGSHVSLIRAAAVCRRWRRTVADAGFLRRYRSLHAPAVGGSYHNNCTWSGFLRGERTGDGPVFLPSSPSVVDARHFSLDFLPGGAASWAVRDSRGSLLIAICLIDLGRTPPDHVVCEPLTWRYARIPLPAVANDSNCRGLFILDGEVDEVASRISMSNFRMLCLFDCSGVTHTSIFTVGSSWSKNKINRVAPNIRRTVSCGRAAGCGYFYDRARSSRLYKLDGSTGKFSYSVLPAIESWDFDMGRYRIAEGCDGKPRIIVVFGHDMKVFARHDSTGWALERKILLWEAVRDLPGSVPSFIGAHHIVTTGVGFVILSQEPGGSWPFSVNLETMEAALVANNMGEMVYQCELPWPPALHACPALRNKALHQ